jgi:hypothetical protein
LTVFDEVIKISLFSAVKIKMAKKCLFLTNKLEPPKIKNQLTLDMARHSEGQQRAMRRAGGGWCGSQWQAAR